MKRGPTSAAVGALLAVLVAGLLVEVSPSAGSSGARGAALHFPIVGGSEGTSPGNGIGFDARARDRIVLTAPGYRLSVGKRNGGLIDLVDRATETHLLRGQNGCLWAGIAASDAPPVTGCSFSPDSPNRLTYRWDKRASTLLLTYESADSAPRRVQALAAIILHDSYFDIRLVLESHWGRTLATVLLPADIFEDAQAVEAGYGPNYLPGIRFKPSFFQQHVGNNVLTYPSRWAFADYLSLDTGGSHLALYSVNPPPNRIAPAQLGFIRNGAPSPCSGDTFCITHAFSTWITDGQTWTSPLVRIRVGASAAESILAYRAENRIDAYPSLADKLGDRLRTLAEAPLIKADLWKGLPPFNEWQPDLARLPSPALVHPVAFQPRGHDENDPDFLPPDPRFGTIDDFRGAITQAHARGQLVMPYLNVSWWDVKSPTVTNLPAPLTLDDITVQNGSGQPVSEQYGDHNGYLVSPYVPFVGDRVARLMEEWRTDVPADCLFFDQIGARPWRRDFNPAAPTPLAYDDGWLELMAPYADRCLMVEDGWDRLAESFVGFHGSSLLLDREFDEPNERWGAGNWEPYPLAVWLLHDKVLMYQHDLYEGTMTADDEVLTFNLAFGFMLSYNWDGDAQTLESPWLARVGAIQKALGPRYAGQALTGFTKLAPDVTETTFGDFSVIANWGASAYNAAGYGVAPHGFLARSARDGVLAGAFAGSFAGKPLSAGTHYLLVSRDGSGLSVRELPAG